MYLYIILVFIIGWIIYPKAKKIYSTKTAKIGFILLLFPVCLFAMGFRSSSVGLDTYVYEKLFYNFARMSWNKTIYDDIYGVEIGMRLMMKSCALIYSNYYFYQFIFSAIYLILFLNFIYKYTSNLILGCAVFLGGGLFMQPFNIARQMFAVAIVAYSIVYLLENKIIKSFLFLGIAYLFHGSSIITSLMFIIYLFRNNKYVLGLIPIVMIFLISSIDSFILPLAYTIFGEEYINYILNEFSRPNTGILLKMLWTLNFFLALISLYLLKNISSIKVLAVLSLFATACFLVGLSINFVDRIGLYFYPAILLMYDRIVSTINHISLKKIYTNGCILIYIIYFCYWTFVNNSISFNSIFD